MDSPYQYFTNAELMCHCNQCDSASKMNHEFMVKLVAIRRETGVPMPLTSAYRCPTHNDNISSTGLTGPHTTGRAVDIPCSGKAAFAIVSSAHRNGMTGIGIKQKGAGRFIHLDDLSGATRPWVWSY